MSIPTGIVDPATKRIVLPRVAKRRLNNPLRPRHTSRGSSTEADEAAERASSDGRSSTAERKEAAAERNLLRMLIKIERREFVTGSSASAMKAAHILGALRRRRKIQSQAGFEKAKTAIEEWLTALGFQYTGDFRLDGASNLLLLCPRMHVHLDVYGTIAFTPTRQRLLDLSIQLAGDNQDWLNRSRADPNAPRNLTNPIYSTEGMDWQVLVLHKDDFLPEEQQLLVLKPEFRTGGLATSPANWALSHVAADPDFKLPTLFLGNERLYLHPVTHISLFAMVVNLHSKVDACKPDQLPEGDQIHLIRLKELLNDLVRLIFYHPPLWTRADDVMKLIAAHHQTGKFLAAAGAGLSGM